MNFIAASDERDDAGDIAAFDMTVMVMCRSATRALLSLLVAVVRPSAGACSLLLTELLERDSIISFLDHVESICLDVVENLAQAAGPGDLD